MGGRQKRRVHVLGAVTHPVEGRHQQHQIDEPPDDVGVAQHVADPGAGQFHSVLLGFPNFGLLHPVSDDQTDQSRDDAQTEQPPPGQPQLIHDQERRHCCEQIAERVALLQQTGEEPPPLDGNLLHRQRGTQTPLAAHADAIQQSQDDQHGEVRRERAQKADHRIEHHVDHQRQPPADPVGPEPEQQCADRAHEQGCGGQERDFGLGVVEGLRDVGVHQHHEEVVEGVHRPAQQCGDERVALIFGERRLSRHSHRLSHSARRCGAHEGSQLFSMLSQSSTMVRRISSAKPRPARWLSPGSV